MPIPTTTAFFEYVMDPADEMDFAINCTTLLDVGETISSFTVTLPAESIFLGLTLGTAVKLAARAGNIITIWLTISPAEQANILYNGTVSLPIEISLVTSSNRKKQRTVAVKVTQQ